jgi:hypothetical protein
VGGEDAADGGLAGSHEAGEDETAKMGGDAERGGGCGVGLRTKLAGGRHYLSWLFLALLLF